MSKNVIRDNLQILNLTASTETDVLSVDSSGNVSKRDVYSLISGTLLMIDVTGTTYTLNESVNYSEILLNITTASTITIDTDQLSNNSIITFKSIGNYIITVDTEGSETIDNETFQRISGYEAMVIYPRYSNWWIK